MATLEIFQKAEAEYGFSAVQLILLMELAGAQSVYTYPLPEEDLIGDEAYILAMQDLIRRGFIERKESPNAQGYALSAEADYLFEDMFDASLVLEAISAWEGTLPMLVYRGKGTSCTVSVWDSVSGYIGIRKAETADIADLLEEAGFLPGHPFRTVREGSKALRYDEKTAAACLRLLGTFRGRTELSPDAPPSLWALQEDVRCALRTIRMPDRRPHVFYVFLETDSESWILTEKYKWRETAETGRPGEIRQKTGNEKRDGAGPDGRMDFEGEAEPDNTISENTGREQMAGEWEIAPDSRELRGRIWRHLI